MKNRKNLFRIACAALFLFTGLPQNSRAQESPKEYWNIRTQLTPLRLPPPPVGYKPGVPGSERRRQAGCHKVRYPQ